MFLPASPDISIESLGESHISRWPLEVLDTSLRCACPTSRLWNLNRHPDQGDPKRGIRPTNRRNITFDSLSSRSNVTLLSGFPSLEPPPLEDGDLGTSTAYFPTNIVNFGGFESSIMLFVRGGILMSMGIFRKV